MASSKSINCPDCGREWRYYSSMMTGACLYCRNHFKGVFWYEERFKKALKESKEATK